MRRALLFVVLCVAGACKKRSEDMFWRDRLEETRASEVAGHRFTIRVPEGIVGVAKGTRTDFEFPSFTLVIGWIQPNEAVEQLMKQRASQRELKVIKVGVDGAEPPAVVVDSIATTDTFEIELAGARVGYVTKLPIAGYRQVLAFLPTGNSNGGFSCEAKLPLSGTREDDKSEARVAAICTSIRTAK